MKKTSITLAAATVLGISLLSSNADAQWSWGWGQSSNSSSCSSSRDTLRSDVRSVDRLANQMVLQFSREMNCRCRNSVALMNHLKKNAGLTRALVVASNGTCKCAFKKAACALNENMLCVAKAARKVNISCSLNSTLETSIKLAKRIHKNADRFTPRNTDAYTNNNRRQTPNYGQPYNRQTNTRQASNNRRSNNRQVSNRGWGSFFSLFGGGQTTPVVDRHDDHGHDDHAGHNH